MRKHVSLVQPTLQSFRALTVLRMIDREFHDWMNEKFGSNFRTGVKPEKKAPGSKFMREFETAKRDFGPRNAGQSFEMSLVIPGAEDSKYYNVEESVVKVSWQVNSPLHALSSLTLYETGTICRVSSIRWLQK
jgi:hypothetical protein